MCTTTRAIFSRSCSFTGIAPVDRADGASPLRLPRLVAGVLAAEASFLQKPFTLDGLTRKVREVLKQEGKIN